MTKHNPANERIKHDYFHYLVEAMGRDDATIDGVAKSLARFEESTRAKSFKQFHREQAVAFKAKLAKAVSARSGDRLSKATLLATLRDLRAFFFWLAHLPGFKSHIAYADADYFNLSDKDVAVARARREKRVPSLEQIHHVLSVMPADTPLQRRDRALVALTALTAARVGALASFKLRHIDLANDTLHHDARRVRTKGAKSFPANFLPVGGDALKIVREWVIELETVHLWGPDDPLFPSTEMGLDEDGGFVPKGLSRSGWATSGPVREIFQRAFAAAGLPYFNPHTIRDMLVQHAMSLNLSHEEMKAWSQSLGHSGLLVTYTSYGNIPPERQRELIRASARHLDRNTSLPSDEALVAAIVARLKG